MCAHVPGGDAQVETRTTSLLVYLAPNKVTKQFIHNNIMYNPKIKIQMRTPCAVK